MNLTIQPNDGTVALSLNKVEQDTLRQTVAFAQDLLHQLDGQTIDPGQVEALRTLATTILTGARGIIATSNQPAPASPRPFAYDLEGTRIGPVVPMGQRTAMTYDPVGTRIGPVVPLGQRATMTNL